MHELGITRNIVAIVSEHAGTAKVQRVSLEIGQLSAVLPQSIRFCFDVCAQGTCLEGAELEIVEVPGLGRCQSCGAIVELDQPFGQCDCGSVALDIIQGEELKIRSFEMEDVCV